MNLFLPPDLWWCGVVCVLGLSGTCVCGGVVWFSVVWRGVV